MTTPPLESTGQKVPMSSIVDVINGAEQTRSYRNPAEERGRAVRLVCAYAHNAEDARQLCNTLGLDPRDGRPQPPQQLSLGPRSVVDSSVPSKTALGGRPVPAPATTQHGT